VTRGRRSQKGGLAIVVPDIDVRRFQERPDGPRPNFRNSQHERGAAPVILRICIGTCIEQLLDNLFTPFRRSGHQGSHAAVVGGLDLRSFG
jgi:hypothetical protein